MTKLDRLVAARAADQHGVVSRQQVIELGLSDTAIDKRLRTGALERVHRGVYRMPGAPNSWRQALMAACLIGDGGFASHRAASKLWDLRGVNNPPVEITMLRRKLHVVRGVVFHVTDTLDPADVMTADRIPVTSPARTLVGLGAVEPRIVGPALKDAVLKGLVTYPRMWHTVRRLSAQGRNGIGVLRAELERLDPSQPPTESMLEDRFVSVMRRAGVELRGQVRIGPFRVDFADPVRKVIVELDGRRWHEAERDRVRDRARRMQLRAAGWTVIEVTWLDLKYWPDLVVAELRQALGAAA
ncbi:MAG: hypothetical protein JWO37_1604 [Acidimicrobiales bacterium]|nr:hypothetical protein [Acidimicrobiales bacterium]